MSSVHLNANLFPRKKENRITKMSARAWPELIQCSAKSFTRQAQDSVRIQGGWVGPYVSGGTRFSSNITSAGFDICPLRSFQLPTAILAFFARQSRQWTLFQTNMWLFIICSTFATSCEIPATYGNACAINLGHHRNVLCVKNAQRFARQIPLDMHKVLCMRKEPQWWYNMDS